MIFNEMFGNPKSLYILHDCVLLDDKTSTEIGKVFFFVRSKSIPVREFGELYPSTIEFGRRSFTGYFQCGVNPILIPSIGSKGNLTIQSSPKITPIYRLKDVIIQKENNSFSSGESVHSFKFICSDYETIFGNLI